MLFDDDVRTLPDSDCKLASVSLLASESYACYVNHRASPQSFEIAGAKEFVNVRTPWG